MRPTSAPREGHLLDSNGSPAAGMVTVRDLETGRRDTVYAVAGRFALPRLPSGACEIGATDGGDHVASNRRIDLGDSDEPLVVKLDDDSPYPRPAAYYATKLRFPDSQMRDDFRMQCRYCHNIGNPITRRTFTVEEWTTRIRHMHAMGALLSSETMAALPAILAAGLDGTYDHALPPPALPDSTIANAHIVEWAIGVAGSYVHDLAVGGNGWIYAVDMNLDRIEAIDTATGSTKSWSIPSRGHRRGGYLRGAAQPVGTTSASQAPHSVEYGADGRLWITHALGSEIAAFDPATGEMQHWSLPRGSYYPHTLRVRQEGVWFTVTLTNQLGRLDPSDGDFELLPLAATTAEQRLAPSMMGATFGLASFWPGEDRQVDFNLTRLSSRGGQVLPAPYGIDVAPDGSIYFTQLYGNRIGRYDPRTGALVHWATPFVGPRRLAVGSDGRLWIPAFGSGLLSVFDPASESYRNFTLPSQPLGEDAPYAVNVHPATGDVWVTSTTQDVLYRFDPRTESFTIYPLPTRGAFMREIEFGPSGEVCTTYSNLPDYHMPDSGVKLMCLFPDGR